MNVFILSYEYIDQITYLEHVHNNIVPMYIANFKQYFYLK